MIFHDTFRANWRAIHNRKAKESLKGKIRENSKHSNYIFVVATLRVFYNIAFKRFLDLSIMNGLPIGLEGVMKYHVPTKPIILTLRQGFCEQYF